jgi:hypothetical protein
MKTFGDNVRWIGNAYQNHVEKIMEAYRQRQFVKPITVLLSAFRMIVASVRNPDNEDIY